MGFENDPVVIADMVFDDRYQHLYICDSAARGRVVKLDLLSRSETDYEWGTDGEVADIDSTSEAFVPSKIALFSTDNLALAFVCAHDGRMAVLDGVNDLQVLLRFSAHGDQVGEVRCPGGMALSKRLGFHGIHLVEHLELYVTDVDADRITVFTLQVHIAPAQPSTLRETASARVIGCSGDAPSFWIVCMPMQDRKNLPAGPASFCSSPMVNLSTYLVTPSHCLAQAGWYDGMDALARHPPHAYS